MVADGMDFLGLVCHFAWIATAIKQKQLLLPNDLGVNLWLGGDSLRYRFHLATGILYLSTPVSGRAFGDDGIDWSGKPCILDGVRILDR